ncbi:LOW QUALITY PROTEIN: hypothetical protein HID58_074542 [Brassica napus]|uniref:Uncharacterized protein n=1 Tax=Brassica napus TaxID=3708 RepID=A0ABQ7YH70_BRANA|nr:LOW QUALITY PROTEIN: hypothetical protein HID58_074542 [Brassica napus]
MNVEVVKRNGLTECDVTYSGGAKQSCLILVSNLYPCKSSLQSFDSQIQYKNFKFENSESKADRCGETIVTKLLHLWEARNVNKGGDLIGVYITLVDEMIYFY